jgi:hypothetical protein
MDTIATIAALKRMHARRRKPETMVEDFAQDFERVGLVVTARRLREVAELV